MQKVCSKRFKNWQKLKNEFDLGALLILFGQMDSNVGGNMTGATIWKRRGDALFPTRERNRIPYCNKGLHVVPSAILHGVVVVQTKVYGATPPSDQWKNSCAFKQSAQWNKQSDQWNNEQPQTMNTSDVSTRNVRQMIRTRAHPNTITDLAWAKNWLWILRLWILPTPRIQPHPTSQMTTKCQKCRKCKNTNAKCHNGRIPKCQTPKCQSKLPNVKKMKCHNTNAKQCQNARDELCSRSLRSDCPLFTHLDMTTVR